MCFQCFLLVGFALNMLVTPFLGNYCISMNPRAIRVVPSNRVTNLYLVYSVIDVVLESEGKN